MMTLANFFSDYLVRMPDWFGPIGMGSVVLTLGLLILLGRLIYRITAHALLLRPYRLLNEPYFALRVVGFALAALLLAKWNSGNVIAIQRDPKIVQEMLEKKRREQERAHAKAEPIAAAIGVKEYAEDSATSLQADMAAMEKPDEDEDGEDGVEDEEATGTEGGNEGSVADASAVEDIPLPGDRTKDEGAGWEVDDADYAYRERGKQSRTPGSGSTGEGFAETEDGEERMDTAALAREATAGEVVGEDVRYLPPVEVTRANRLDKLNLFLVRWGLLFALLAALWDYLHRFNSHQWSILPLPIAGRLVDLLSPKTLSLLIVDGDRETMRRYAHEARQRGQSWIHFGDNPLLEEDDEAAALCYRGDEPEFDPGFILDVTWYGRHDVSLAGRPAAETMRTELVQFLRNRRQMKARAWQTLNVLWERPLPEGDSLLRLLHLAHATNCRFVTCLKPEAAKAVEHLFEEVIEDSGEYRINHNAALERPLPASWSEEGAERRTHIPPPPPRREPAPAGAPAAAAVASAPANARPAAGAVKPAAAKPAVTSHEASSKPASPPRSPEPRRRRKSAPAHPPDARRSAPPRQKPNTPAGKPPAAPQQRRQPPQQRPAPQQQRPAPQQQRPAPQQQRPAPQQQRPAPQQQRPAPQQQRPAPEQQRQARPQQPQQGASGRGGAGDSKGPAAGNAAMKLRCPKCRSALKIPSTFAGKAMKCPKCAAKFRVPG